MADMAHMKVYNKYSGMLVTVLPMNDVTFLAKLTSNGILPGNVGAHIKTVACPTAPDKADYYLSNVIKTSLDGKQTAEFNKLIAVMEKCEYSHIETIANEMKSDLEKELKGGSKRLPDSRQESHKTKEGVTHDKLDSDTDGKKCPDAIENITKHFDTLTKSFLIDKWVPSLVSKKVIDDEQKEEMNTKALKKDKLSYFFDEVIKPELVLGISTKYDNLIEVLKAGDDAAKGIADLLEGKTKS